MTRTALIIGQADHNADAIISAASSGSFLFFLLCMILSSLSVIAMVILACGDESVKRRGRTRWELDGRSAYGEGAADGGGGYHGGGPNSDGGGGSGGHGGF
ncbi:hypothetical protein Ancab_007748 [Ancistrocladus abbreviatus]